jgi:hypothetical protein
MNPPDGIQQQQQKPTKRGQLFSWSGLPRVWRPVGWILLRDVRERQFLPVYEDAYQDYLLDLHQLRIDQHRFRMASRWVAMIKFGMNVRFVFWIAKLLAECIWGTFKQRE